MAGSPVVVLDVGASKILCLVGEVQNNSQVKILGLGQSPCTGLRRSAVIDMPQVAESIRAALAAWFRERAAETLPDIVKRWVPSLGGDGPTRILIRNQKQRWGSCSADGTLRFNWRVIMLPPELIDYIVVHELAHLRHQNHSREYWDHVTAAMPDAIQRRKALREAGQNLPTL